MGIMADGIVSRVAAVGGEEANKHQVFSVCDLVA